MTVDRREVRREVMRILYSSEETSPGLPRLRGLFEILPEEDRAAIALDPELRGDARLLLKTRPRLPAAVFVGLVGSGVIYLCDLSARDAELLAHVARLAGWKVELEPL